jgi:mono/diheme cytochrome c family protein
MREQNMLIGLPSNTDSIGKVPVWNEPATGSLDERARAYLDMNCAHCHSPAGKAAASGLFLNRDLPLSVTTGLCKPPVAAGRGAGGFLLDIVPGRPEDSILLHRLNQTDGASKMPQLGKSVVHDEGVELIRAWIQSIPGECP